MLKVPASDWKRNPCLPLKNPVLVPYYGISQPFLGK